MYKKGFFVSRAIWSKPDKVIVTEGKILMCVGSHYKKKLLVTKTERKKEITPVALNTLKELRV